LQKIIQRKSSGLGLKEQENKIVFIKIKRVMNPQKYLTFIPEGKDFYVGYKIEKGKEELLFKLGFSEKLDVGEKVLPFVVGNISKFNAEGKEKIRKDLPKETVYYPREWTVKDWGGHEHSGVSYMPYERYPREQILPPGIELYIMENNGEKFVVSDKLNNLDSKAEEIKHIVNLFAELFKGIEIFKEDMSLPIKAKIIRLNWEILPPGMNPWPKVREQIREVVKKNSSSAKFMLEKRLALLEKYNPNTVAVGLGGFTGYIVFGFKDKDFYLLESVYYGNATYVLGRNWQDISQMTKAEILNNDLHEYRLIHSEGWDKEVGKLLK
jgi:hypothetical protein